MRWFDTHCHLDHKVFDKTRSSVLEACYAEGLQRFLVVGVAPSSFDSQVRICKQNELMFALGVHPWFIDADVNTLQQQLEHAIKRYHPVAIGECGLDRVKGAPWEMQLRVFHMHLDLASALHLPLVIHSVKANHWVLEALRQRQGLQGVIHGFNGSWQQAQAFIDLGFKIGIGALVCNLQAKKLRHTVQHIALEGMVLETDSPFSHQCETASLSRVFVDVAQEVAKIKGISIEQVAETTFATSCALFCVDRSESSS